MSDLDNQNDSPHSSFPYRRATAVYVLALFILGVAVTVGYELVAGLAQQTAQDAKIVNAAGRQRMLAQRMARTAIAMESATSPSKQEAWKQELKKTFEVWVLTHEVIVRNRVAPRLGLLPLGKAMPPFTSLETHYDAIRKNAQLLIDEEPSKTKEVSNELGESSDAYVMEMDILLAAIERDSEARAKSVASTLRWIIGLALLLLAIEGVFVFRPLIQGLRDSYSRLHDSHTRLQQEFDRRIEAERTRDVLQGLLPICAGCKKIRDDEGAWRPLEQYIEDRSEARFSHGLCVDCIRQLYPAHADAILAKLDEQET